MAFKIISFLGTTTYQKCTYTFPGEIKIEDEKFFQIALSKYFKKIRGKNDIKTIVFCTEEAVKYNLKCNTRKDRSGKEFEYLGLEHEVQAYGREFSNNFIYKDRTRDNSGNIISIPKGFDEEDIWIILKMLFDEIEEGDEIVFDITHGFRSLPMIAIVILNYARYLKNIKIVGIYYGAFEAKKDILNAKGELIGLDVPAYDMSNFNLIIEWIIGMEKYLSSGESSNLLELVNETRSRVNNNKVSDEDINFIERWMENLNKFSKAVGLSDSYDITFIGNEIGKDVIQSKKIASKMIPALDIAMEKIEERFIYYKPSDIVHNVHEATKWCYENNMIQQGYTLLRENLITYIYEFLNFENSIYYKEVEKFKKYDKETKDIIRDYIGTSLNRGFKQLEYYNGDVKVNYRDKKINNKHEAYVKKSFKYNKQKYNIYKYVWTSQISNNIFYIFNELRIRRNYINHAGFTKLSKNEKEKLVDDLKSFVEEFSNIIENK